MNGGPGKTDSQRSDKDMSRQTQIVWSYGGGVQSVCIGVLIHNDVLPVPDLTCIADTGRECSSTWQYMREHMQPYLNKVGCKIQVIPHSISRIDLFNKNGLTLMPAFTAEGRLASFCSGEWKRDTVMRWLRLQGVKSCEQWIGYSMDEIHRVPKQDRRQWCRLAFPLIDRFINRAMCYAIIDKAGLPVPKKSRCYCCPHQTLEEWKEVLSGQDKEKAIAIDNEVRERDEQKAIYLYSGRIPLEIANFDKDNGLLPPVKTCETGHCWT